MQNEQLKANRIQRIIRKVFQLSFISFGLSFLVVIIYGFINEVIKDWKILLGVVIAMVFMSSLGYIAKRMEDADTKGAKIRKIEYFAAALLGIICLSMVFLIVVGVYKDINKKILYRKISNEEFTKTLEKSKQDIKTTLTNIDISINALSNSKSRTEILINEARANKEMFLKQIDKLNTIEEEANSLDDKNKELNEALVRIQQITQGKNILTVEEYNKSQNRSVFIGFLLGIVASFIASVIYNVVLKRLKRKISSASNKI